jgi:hypothetical protein
MSQEHQQQIRGWAKKRTPELAVVNAYYDVVDQRLGLKANRPFKDLTARTASSFTDDIFGRSRSVCYCAGLSVPSVMIFK